MEELIEHLNKVVNGLEVGKTVVCCVNTYAEEKTSVPPIDDLEISKLQEKQISQ